MMTGWSRSIISVAPAKHDRLSAFDVDLDDVDSRDAKVVETNGRERSSRSDRRESRSSLVEEAAVRPDGRIETRRSRLTR